MSIFPIIAIGIGVLVIVSGLAVAVMFMMGVFGGMATATNNASGPIATITFPGPPSVGVGPSSVGVGPPSVGVGPPSVGVGPSSVGESKGKRILNTRKVNGVPVDAAGRFYVACYGPDDGYGGKGAYSNDLVPMKSIALPRGRTDGRDVSTLTRSTHPTTAFDHPLVSPHLRNMKTWTNDDEYRFMKDEKNRPRYLMVDENGAEHCVRVDDKCEGCYWGDRGIDGSKGFDFDVYTNHSDATCWKHRPNQWVEIYETDAC